MSDRLEEKNPISRRKFIQISGALTAGSTLSAGLMPNRVFAGFQEEKQPKIKKFKTLGRTGFQASDVSMGGTRVREANIFRYAYDCGVNYFDVAEGYHNGDAERELGKALKHMERKKVFITTKLHLDPDESEESILNRFRECLKRLDTNYIDALYMHSVKKVSLLDKPEFHSAIAKLKADGKLRFNGLSSHGPRRDSEDSMEKVMLAAAEDGRFDLMLFIYNFMNRESGDKILKACKENNVGATAMKTSPGVLKVDDYNSDQPTEEQESRLRRYRRRYDSQEEIDQKMKEWINNQKETMKKIQPFVDKYGVKTEEQLRINSIRWILQNPDMHTVCVSFKDFDFIDKLIPFSGEKLDEQSTGFLNNFKDIYNNQYCRHGCTDCISTCPELVPVSTIMRYAYYYEHQGREKEAIQKYQKLSDMNVSKCNDCTAPCLNSCQHHIDIPRQLSKAHQMLTLA
jgi:predicted aldo/keto reductase-like oxidoreductase